MKKLPQGIKDEACGHARARNIKSRTGPSCRGDTGSPWPRPAVATRNCGYQLKAGLGSWGSEEVGGGNIGTGTGPPMMTKDMLKQSRETGSCGQNMLMSGTCWDHLGGRRGKVLRECRRGLLARKSCIYISVFPAHQIFIEHLLCAWCCFRSWGFNSGTEVTKTPVFTELMFA